MRQRQELVTLKCDVPAPGACGQVDAPLAREHEAQGGREGRERERRRGGGGRRGRRRRFTDKTRQHEAEGGRKDDNHSKLFVIILIVGLE